MGWCLFVEGRAEMDRHCRDPKQALMEGRRFLCHMSSTNIEKDQLARIF
jgi:hypothetical protein